MKKKVEPTMPSDRSVFSRNMILSAIVAVVVVGLSLLPGYSHIVYDVAIAGNEAIDKNERKRINFNQPELSLQDKRMLAIDNYWYIEALQKSTPMRPTTVILLPPRSYLADNLAWVNFTNSSWMEYFVYPRLVISEDEKESKPDLYKKITHVAVIKNWGFDRLRYVPERIEEYAIYAIDTVKKEVK